MSEGFEKATTGRQLCAYCRTELAADALVCEACGMSTSVLTAPALRPPPAPPEVTAPALRPAPEPPEVTSAALRPAPEPPAPEVTAAALRPPPEPPALTAPALRPPPEPPAATGDDPLAAAPVAIPQSGPPRVAAGDPLAPPPTAAGDPLAAALLSSSAGSAAPSGPAGSASGGHAVGRRAAGSAAPAAPSGPAAPAGSRAGRRRRSGPRRRPLRADAPSGPAAPADPAKAHPSDATPAGYVTAASLWPVSTRRPSASTAPPSAPPDSSEPAEAASVGRAAAPQGAAPAPAAPAVAGASVTPLVASSAQRADGPPPRAFVPANRSRIDKRTTAIVAAVVLLATVATVAVLVLTGGSEPKPLPTGSESPPANAVVEQETPEPSATAKPVKAPKVDAQVKTLDGLMRLSEKGRAAAVNGDIKTATAQRATLLRDLERLDAQATDKQLKAALATFIPAITEALRQNRECGSKCSTADLNKVARLKQAALNKVNPLLKAHGGDTYRLKDI